MRQPDQLPVNPAKIEAGRQKLIERNTAVQAKREQEALQQRIDQRVDEILRDTQVDARSAALAAAEAELTGE
ncbi:hypothetical protein [Jiangella endophytica]|uniref:hypothetical protein n=1 Tax=Jiangella endophytica TaxID=1623398 RepID=UPI000E3544D1|nr:hypothetical protein [Jiangella endophytica]